MRSREREEEGKRDGCMCAHTDVCAGVCFVLVRAWPEQFPLFSFPFISDANPFKQA